MLGLVASLLLSATAEASERWETLRAINWVENPTNHTRPGAFGELGPYQFRPQTWRMHTRKPFSWAVERAHADEIAVKHYEWLRRELREAGIDPSPYNIALAWNSGIGAVTSGRVPRISYDYANRVANLVAAQKARLSAAPRQGVAGGGPRPVAPQFSLEASETRALGAFNFPLAGSASAPLVAAFRFAAADQAADDLPVIRAGSAPAGVAVAEHRPEKPMFAIGATASRFLLPE